jgi:glycosyltransferase involved in cell wall biosynthesis
MHILIAVLHRPTKPTGVCRHAANLARCLADLSNVTRVTLVTGIWQRHYFETAFGLSSPKIHIIDVSIQNCSTARNLWYLLGLPKLVKQLKPDIVHLSFPVPFWRSLFICPVVATIHDLYSYECPENFGQVQASFIRLFLRQCINQSDGLSCVSQETLKKLQRFFPEACVSREVRVTYNSVDFRDTVPLGPEVFKGKGAVPFLLSVAQHRKNKNLHLLIQAFANLLESQKLEETTELVLVGSPGPETEHLQQQIAALQLQRNIRLLASVSDRELYWLYHNSLLYITASSTEGFCLPLAEALSLGCRAVCSDISILREVAVDDCIYFSLEGDPIQNLEWAILEAIHMPSKNPVDQDFRFSGSTIAKQYLQFYSRVMERSQYLFTAVENYAPASTHTYGAAARESKN